MTLKGNHSLNAAPVAQVNWWCGHAEAQEQGVLCKRGVRMQIHGVSKGTSTLMLVDSDHLRYGGSDSDSRTPGDALWGLQTLRSHPLVYPGFLTCLDGTGSDLSPHGDIGINLIRQVAKNTALPPVEDISETSTKNHKAAPPTPISQRLFLISSLQFRRYYL